MRAVAVFEPGKVGIVEVATPRPDPYEVLVKSEIAYICNATDRKVVSGHFPGMGREAYPLLLGHETVGRVVEKGAKVRSFAVGDRVLGGLVISPEGYGSGWGETRNTSSPPTTRPWSPTVSRTRPTAGSRPAR